jgi:hypothetical protein
VLKDERISLNDSMIANFVEIYYGKVRIVEGFGGGIGGCLEGIDGYLGGIGEFLRSLEDLLKSLEVSSGFPRVFLMNFRFLPRRFAHSSL